MLLQPRGQQGKEKRAEHFMAIINQRGKSSRRNKKLPYPGHRDLPGSSPRCPAALPPPSCLPGQGPDLVPGPQAEARHLPRDTPAPGSQQPWSLCTLGLGTSHLWASVACEWALTSLRHGWSLTERLKISSAPLDKDPQGTKGRMRHPENS